MIYRGFDIKQDRVGTWYVVLNDVIMAVDLATDEAAMNWVDQYKRENRP